MSDGLSLVTRQEPLVFDNTTIELYQTCPRKFEYRILGHYVPKGTARALEFGLAIHEGLAAWYRTWKDPKELLALKLKRIVDELYEDKPVRLGTNLQTTQELREEIAVLITLASLPPLSDRDAGDRRTADLAEDMIRMYAKLYRHEPFRILLTEQNFIFPLSENILYCGILDLVIEWTQRVIIMDHKTTSSIYKFGEKYSPNSQITGYILGAKTVMDGVSNEACINALQVPKRKSGISPDDFQRFPNIHRSDELLEEFAQNTLHTIEHIAEDSNRGYFQMNTNSCHAYGGCPYLDVCRTSPNERGMMLDALYEKKEWDPVNRDAEEGHLKVYTENPTEERETKSDEVPNVSEAGQCEHGGGVEDED